MSAHLARLTRRLRTRQPIRILAIGSSSTQGIGASSPDHAYPARLEADLRGHWPRAQITVTNAGIGGEKVPTTLKRFEDMVTSRKFDLVIWQLGTNDAVGGGDVEVFRKLTLDGIVEAHTAGVSLILLDPQYFPGIHDVPRYERYVASIKELADEEHVPVFQRYAMMKSWNAQGADQLLANLSGDRFHMNDRGYDCLAQAMSDAIARMIDGEAPLAAADGAMNAAN